MKLFHRVRLWCAVFVLALSHLQAQPTSAGNMLFFGTGFLHSGEYVFLNHQAQFNFPGSFTFEAWVKPYSYTQDATIAIKQGVFELKMVTDAVPIGNGVLSFHTAGLSPATVVGTAIVDDGVWHHVAAIYDASGTARIRIFVDGVLDVSTNVTGTLSQSTSNVLIGANASLSQSYQSYKGYIDEIRFWDTDRSATQIANNMHTLLAGDEANLLAYLRVDDGTGTKLSDDSPNGNFGTMHNDPQWVSSTAPIGPPVLTTEAVSNITATSADLYGTAYPAGQPSSVWFKYGLTTSYGSTTAKSMVRKAELMTNYFATVTGLSPGTVYHYRAEGTNEGGTGTGTDMTFTTADDVPNVSNVSTSSITTNSARLNADVQPNGATTRLYFEYGLNDSYGSFSTTNNLGNGTTIVSTNIVITGLLPARGYHFRAVAFNNVGSDVGSDKTFVTDPVLPAIIQQSASPTSRGATLTANVNPNGSPTDVYFQYGTTVSYGKASATIDFGAGSAANQDSATVGTLLPGTLYNYRTVASNIVGAKFGANATFTTLAEAPTITTVAAGNITSTGATFNANATPNGASTLVYFRYGTTTSYGSKSATNTIGSGNSSVPVSTVVSGLLSGKTYHFQGFASNNVGTDLGQDLTVTIPPQVPGAVTTTPTISTNGASLSASINPNGALTKYYFRYGPTTNYGSVTATNSMASGNSATAVSSFVSGLAYATVYHCQVIASNSAGKVSGNDVMFTSATNSPSITTLDAANVTGTNAVLNAVVNANGAATTLYFNYGTKETYGSASASVIVPAGFTGITNITVSGLVPVTRYHFRAVAFNSKGTNNGTDAEFITVAVPPALSASTQAPTEISHTGATFNAVVNPNNAITTTYFQYGLSTNYGSVSSVTILPASNLLLFVSSPATGLSPGVLYHYRIVGSNSVGTNSGGDWPILIPVLPTISNVSAGNGSVAFQFSGAANLPYTLQGSSDLLQWNDVTNFAPAPEGVFNFSAEQATDEPQVFYRLKNP